MCWEKCSSDQKISEYPFKLLPQNMEKKKRERKKKYKQTNKPRQNKQTKYSQNLQSYASLGKVCIFIYLFFYLLQRSTCFAKTRLFLQRSCQSEIGIWCISITNINTHQYKTYLFGPQCYHIRSSNVTLSQSLVQEGL